MVSLPHKALEERVLKVP